MYYRTLFVPIIALLLQSSAFGQPIELSLDVQRHELRNGLQILTLEDHTLPVLSFYTFFRAGSRNEQTGITGISHLLEHMMFNGARRYGPKEFDRVLESNGGYGNAYTTEDMTVYHESLPSDHLELVIDLESDRMAHLALTTVGVTNHSPTALGWRSLVNVTAGPMNTSSPIVTPL